MATLVRDHGGTTCRATGGWTDTGLTERGRRQAACLAERLQHELDSRACRFVCSDSWWLGLEVGQMSRVSFAVAPASLSVLTVNRWGEQTLERLNDTAHLQAIGLTDPILTED